MYYESISKISYKSYNLTLLFDFSYIEKSGSNTPSYSLHKKKY